MWNEPEKAQALGKERVALEGVVNTIHTLDQGLEDVEGLLELAIVKPKMKRLSMKPSQSSKN